MQKMKIGLVSPFMPHDLADLLDHESRDLLPGIAGVTATPVTPMAREWHRAGHELAIFCLDVSVSTPQVLRGTRLVIHVLPKRRSRHCLLDFYRQECRLVREAVAREAPDVLSAQWSYDHALAALGCGIPTAVTCHDTPLRYAWISKTLFMTYHLLVAAWVIRRAQGLICVSSYTAEHIHRYFRPQCPLVTIPNGLDRKIFARKKTRMTAVKTHHETYTICSVGSWGAIKNIKTLLKAFSLHSQSHIESRLVLFGSALGPGEAGECWAVKHNLHHGVVFMGSKPREGILDFLENEADLMVHPSRVETHGMVLIEAMACGVPVIGGRMSGAIPWTLDQGNFGYLCEIRDPQAIARTISKAIDEPQATQKMTERAWDGAYQRFSIEQSAAANIEFLAGLANP